MEHLDKASLNGFESVKKRGYYAFRKYSNYNFYFVETEEGLKEIRAIHIYEDGKKLFTMSKPWFEGRDEIFFEYKLRMKKNILFDNDQYFYTNTKNKKHMELHISNSVVGFKKVGVEETSGFYKKVEIYGTDNKNFGFHKEKVFIMEDKTFIKRIQDRCMNNKKAVVFK